MCSFTFSFVANMVVMMIDDDHDKYNASCLQLETKRPTFTI